MYNITGIVIHIDIRPLNAECCRCHHRHPLRTVHTCPRVRSQHYSRQNWQTMRQNDRRTLWIYDTCVRVCVRECVCSSGWCEIRHITPFTVVSVYPLSEFAPTVAAGAYISFPIDKAINMNYSFLIFGIDKKVWFAHQIWYWARVNLFASPNWNALSSSRAHPKQCTYTCTSTLYGIDRLSLI